MNNVNIRLRLDRRSTNGTATLKGKVNNQDVDLTVRRGVTDATARVSGDWGGTDNVNLAFNRDIREGYNGIKGEWKGRDLNARMRRDVDGDTTVRMGSERLEIDRDQRGENVAYRGTDTRGYVRRELREGDESGTLRGDDDQLRFKVDRDPRSGDFEISGSSSAGRFRLDAERSPIDGSLEFSGTMPEGTTMFPLLWEVLGDDKNIPDNNPLYPSSVMGMSMFIAGN